MRAESIDLCPSSLLPLELEAEGQREQWQWRSRAPSSRGWLGSEGPVLGQRESSSSKGLWASPGEAPGSCQQSRSTGNEREEDAGGARESPAAQVWAAPGCAHGGTAPVQWGPRAGPHTLSRDCFLGPAPRLQGRKTTGAARATCGGKILAHRGSSARARSSEGQAGASPAVRAVQSRGCCVVRGPSSATGQ